MAYFGHLGAGKRTKAVNTLETMADEQQKRNGLPWHYRTHLREVLDVIAFELHCHFIALVAGDTKALNIFFCFFLWKRW